MDNKFEKDNGSNLSNNSKSLKNSDPKVISAEEVIKTSGMIDTKKVQSVLPNVNQPLPQQQAKVISLEEIIKVSGPVKTQDINSTVPMTQQQLSSIGQSQIVINNYQPVHEKDTVLQTAPQSYTVPQVKEVVSAEAVKQQSVKALQNDFKKNESIKKMKKNFKKTKFRKKADIINFLLILAIFILAIFIIAPPVLRKLMPQQYKPIISGSKDTIILSCTAINKDEKYKIVSRSKYTKNNLVQNIITYQYLGDNQLDTKTNAITNLSVNEEINFFKKIRGVIVNSQNNTTIISIYDYVALKNANNDIFMQYFQEKEKQRKFYEQRGYTCEEILS